MLASVALVSLVLQPPGGERIGPAEWRASWIWGSVHAQGGVGYFRRVFELAAPAERFVVQMSGDDGYELLLDGVSVATGGFWWYRTDVHELGPLAAGRHVLAAKVDNAAFPGGLLVQATALGEGLWEEIVSDAHWRFAGEAPEGWAAVEYDDHAWESAQELGRPPVGPWRELPIRSVGPTLELELMDSRVSLHGRTVRAEVEFRVRRNDAYDRSVSIELNRDGRPIVRALLQGLEPTSSWAEGAVVRIGGEVTLQDFAPAGTYQVCIGPVAAAYGGDPSMQVGEVLIEPVTAEYPRVEVRDHRGAPALFIEGEPVFPLVHMSCAIAPEDIRAAAEQGIHLETIGVDLGWVGIGRYDYRAAEEAMYRVLEADPKALILPRVHISAPADWLDAHPDEVVQYANPASWSDHSLGGPRHPSYASRKWRDDAADALRRLVQHCREAGYAGRIMGWHLAAGIYGEWHYWNAPYYPDTSPSFERAYAQWLRSRYPEDPPQARIPTLEERRHADLGMLRDPTASRWLIDYCEFLHLQGAEALDELARVAKEESGGRSLVLAFNGYLPDLNWNQEGDHRRFDLSLRSPNIDAFASPHSYGRRGLGQDAIMRGFPASVRAAGKLWFDEEDDRTSLAADPAFTHVATVEESIELLWRGFAHALTHSCGLWYMDQQGGWYRDPRIWAAFGRMRQVGAESMARQRERVSEVAVVSSFRNAFYLADRSSGLDKVTNALINPQLEQLSICGAPFDLYLITELFEESVPAYKAYVFLDTFMLTDDEYAKVQALIESGRTVLFSYAPGIVSETELSLERMRQLLGMPVELTESMELATGERQFPGFVVPGLSEPVARRGNVLYCPAPPVLASTLRELLREAGVHIYLDSGDPLMVGGGYIAVHAATDGDKTLRAIAPADWTNVRTGETLARDAAAVTVPMRRGETLVLEVR